MGCIALEDIEIGTLILKEKPQCIASTPDGLIQSFKRMSKSDQDEYMKLYNAFAGRQGFSDVFGIYRTNAFPNGLGIRASRFNHSCSSTSGNSGWNEKDGAIEIRAWSKIKAGKFLYIY